MKLRELERNDVLIEEAMDLYAGSFPWYENRSREAHMKAMTDKEFHCKAAVSDGGSLIGLLFYWLHDNILFVEHLAVHPDMRGQNFGNKILERLIGANPGKTILLEIDPPRDDISMRRLRFYERLGFVVNDIEYEHPSFYTGHRAYPHRLVILSHGHRLSDEDLMRYMKFMRSTILKYRD